MPNPKPEGAFRVVFPGPLSDIGAALGLGKSEKAGVVGDAPTVGASSVVFWIRGLGKLDAVLVGILDVCEAAEDPLRGILDEFGSSLSSDLVGLVLRKIRGAMTAARAVVMSKRT